MSDKLREALRSCVDAMKCPAGVVAEYNRSKALNEAIEALADTETPETGERCPNCPV